MKYVKATRKSDSTQWAVYSYKHSWVCDKIIECFIYCHFPQKVNLDCYWFNHHFKVEYLTAEQVDLLKLELL